MISYQVEFGMRIPASDEIVWRNIGGSWESIREAVDQKAAYLRVFPGADVRIIKTTTEEVKDAS